LGRKKKNTKKAKQFKLCSPKKRKNLKKTCPGDLSPKKTKNGHLHGRAAAPGAYKGPLFQ